MSNQSIRLIVNADDYGYFPSVSRGILKAADLGAVSATGILANGPKLEEQIGWLRKHENLDLGVHLNLTSRNPLTSAMAGKLRSSGGSFLGAFAMAGRIITGQIGLETIRQEWRAQIETLMGHRLELRFLNSHEHIHMLPSLFSLTLELAEEYRIPQVRLTRAEWLPSWGFSAFIRNLSIQAMESINKPRSSAVTPLFIGLGGSGKLDYSYLKNLFGRLQTGNTYELMCHPGSFDRAEITDPRLLSYHHWERELELLTSLRVRDLYREYGIRIVNYRGI